jgi:membrane associated rhomboid family serine protease
VIIPIGHDQQIRRYPWVTIALIALCTLVQIYSTVAAPGEREIKQLQADLLAADTDEEAQAVLDRAESMLDKIPTWRFGYRIGDEEDSGISYRLITSAFVHEGWFHLIGNMLFLWLVGSALEDRWGRWRFALFYCAGAIAATYAFKLAYSGGPTVLIGASGAVSAAMGAFLVYFYKTQITLWYFIMYRTGTFRLASYVALPLWLVDQVLMASLDRRMDGVSSVAYAAHIGGFAFGLVSAIVAQMIFGNRPKTHDDDAGGDADEAPVRRDAQDDSRERQLLEAIKRKELGTVRTLGSRVMIDLARQKDHRRILDLYRAIAKAGFKTMPLTDGAFVAVAASADDVQDFRGYVEIAEALRLEHPGSVQVPKILWRLSELHAQSGNAGEELATLKHLAERYPRHEHGALAVKALAKRSA